LKGFKDKAHPPHAGLYFKLYLQLFLENALPIVLHLVKWYNININDSTEVSSGIYACGDRSCGGTDLVGSTSTRSLKQEADCS